VTRLQTPTSRGAVRELVVGVNASGFDRRACGASGVAAHDPRDEDVLLVPARCMPLTAVQRSNGRRVRRGRPACAVDSVSEADDTPVPVGVAHASRERDDAFVTVQKFQRPVDTLSGDTVREVTHPDA
jgi:hypothetical protein